MQDENNAIAKASSVLDALEPKAKTPRGAMALVEALHDKITGALDKGYTFKEIAALLKGSGVEIKESTLRQYYKRKAGDAVPKKRATKKRTPSAQPSPADKEPAL